MTDPDAKDHQWLAARERGEDISHVPAGERAAYDRLGALLGSGIAPRAGFRQRVLDAIDAAEAAPAAAGAEVIPIRRQEPARRRPRWIAPAGALAVAAAAAAAVLVVLAGQRGADTSPVVALESRLLEGPEVLRGSTDRGNQASIGQTLVIRARVTGGPAEVRVYGGSNDRLIASCRHPGECAIESDGEHRWLVLRATLQAPGKVHTVVFAGARVPASSGALDPDIDAAQAQQVPHKLDPRTWTVL